MAIDGAKIRSTLLQVIQDQQTRAPGASLQSSGVLDETARTLRGAGQLTQGEQQAVLVVFSDLFRSGHLAWGLNLSNPDPPKFHVTEQGRLTLKHLSRDPANPDGYLAYLNSRAKLTPLARSYVVEALQTYNASCFRAAAVMIGVAAESMMLLLRDVVVAGIELRGRTPAKDLASPFIKRVSDALHKELEMQQSAMSEQLRENFRATWSALAYQIRTARNEAGHPASMSPVTPDTVHGSLLMFPDLAGVWAKLLKFAATHYKETKS